MFPAIDTGQTVLRERHSRPSLDFTRYRVAERDHSSLIQLKLLREYLREEGEPLSQQNQNKNLFIMRKKFSQFTVPLLDHTNNSSPQRIILTIDQLKQENDLPNLSRRKLNDIICCDSQHKRQINRSLKKAIAQKLRLYKIR